MAPPEHLRSIDVEAIFANDIAPKLDDLERERQSVVATSIQRVLIGGAIVAALMLVTLFLIDIEAPIVIAIFGAVGVWIWFELPREAFVSKLRNDVISTVCAAIDDLDYNIEADGFDLQSFDDLGLFQGHSSKDTRDHFHGRYRNCDFDLAHAKLETGGRNRTTVFDGLCLRVSMPRPTRGQILIYSDLGQTLNRMMGMFRSVSRVEIPHARFEDKFEVYSDDADEALQFITPAFVENFLGLSKATNSTKIVAAFHEAWFYLAINDVPDFLDAFSVSKPVTDVRNQLQRVFEEIAIIYRIIDQLHEVRPVAAKGV